MDQPTIISQLPVQTSVPPPEIPTKPSERNWEKFIIIFLVIAMIFCSGIYVFALTKQKNTPSPSPTPAIVHSPTATPTITPMSTPSATPSSGQVYCTMEVKMCPDGSSIGRSGPNCEFKACPIAK